MRQRYNDLNTYFRSIFGCRVQKITLDAGLTCPNRDGTISTDGCIFCNARGSGSGAFDQGMSITDQILQGKNFLSRRYKARKFIAYFQSYSNTYPAPQILERLYDEALAVDDIVGLAVGTRPDCVSESVLDLLQAYTPDYLIWLEYGLQSASDETLKFINRGHDLRCFKEAIKKTSNRGIKICVHVILGLPHENRKDMLNTARIISALGVDGIKLHLLYVVKGTQLETYYRQGKYHCLEQQEYVDLVCDFIERIPSDMIIQRLTGDPHPTELVAPQWALKKSETLARIRNTLENRDSWQGCKYKWNS